MVAPEPIAPPSYRVIQMVWTARTNAHNAAVEDFEGLVTHHPQTNGAAALADGVVRGGQAGRSFGVVGGEIQEIEVATPNRTYGLGPDQVLLKKDFMLEDPRLPTGPGSRSVDVPSPVDGVVGRAEAASGLVDILDREGGEVIARIRHMSPLLVQAGDAIAYGQAIGVQNKQATGAIHVHMEVDTRYYQQYENYLGDLVSGRLGIDPARRDAGIAARAVVDDGVFRIGESAEIVRVVQQRLNEEGYRGADGQPLTEDGVYRLSMQKAVINYQEAQGLPSSGDLDLSTVQRIAPVLLPPTVNPTGAPSAPPYLNIHGQMPAAPPATEVHSPLLLQAQDAMHRLDASLGHAYGAQSERLAASAACLAKNNGLSSVDHIVLSQPTASCRGGENLFVVEGELADPAHRRASMSTAQALATPVEESVRRLQESELASPTHAQSSAQTETLVQEEPRARTMG